MAIKFFESTDCVGKNLILKDGSRNEAYKITGVFKEIPRQSLMQFDFVIPFSKFLLITTGRLKQVQHPTRHGFCLSIMLTGSLLRTRSET